MSVRDWDPMTDSPAALVGSWGKPRRDEPATHGQDCCCRGCNPFRPRHFRDMPGAPRRVHVTREMLRIPPDPKSAPCDVPGCVICESVAS